jgi:adenosylcobinamide-GDP ribazoletransferase
VSAFDPRVGSFRLAVAFLTVVPVRLRGEAPALGSAAGWFPVVGALLGAAAGGVDYLAEPSLGRNVAAILATGLLVGLSGGLHQDGLADAADGLGGHRDRSRRLAIMRDSSIGTFGALALIFWVALVVSGLAGLDRGAAAAVLVVAACTGRWAALLHAASAPSARPDGLGAGFVVGRVALVVSGVGATALAVWLLGVGHGLAAVTAVAAVGLAVSWWSRRTLGGRTGDTLGACVAIGEVAVVLVVRGLTG